MSFRNKIIKLCATIKSHGKQSLAKLARQTNYSKSSTHRQIKVINKRSSNVCSAFFETEEGFGWLVRLVVAVLFIFGIKCNIGAETIASFFSLIKINHYAGLSASSINRIEERIRDILTQYEDYLQPQLEKLAKLKDLIAGADETFFDRFMVLLFMDLPSGFLFHEKLSEDRTFETWERKTKAAIKQFNSFLCLVSDRAKALLKLGKHNSCTNVADLFHFLMKPVRAFKFSFARKLKTLNKETRQLTAELNSITQEADTQRISAQLESLNQTRLVLQQGQATYRGILSDISITAHPFSLHLEKQNAQQVSTQLTASVVALQNVLTDCAIDDKKDVTGKMRKQIPSIAALTELWWQQVDTDVALLEASSQLRVAVTDYLLPAMYFKLQIKKAKAKKSLRNIYQKAYNEALQKLMAHSLASELNAEPWQTWAIKTCQKYQRTTSAIEGRNGLLAGFNLCARGMTETQLKAQTIIHNYWIQREDGTTAVERCFNFKPEINLFEFILQNIKELPMKRYRNKSPKLPCFQ